jgi:hypothetical protein
MRQRVQFSERERVTRDEHGADGPDEERDG